MTTITDTAGVLLKLISFMHFFSFFIEEHFVIKKSFSESFLAFKLASIFDSTLQPSNRVRWLKNHWHSNNSGHSNFISATERKDSNQVLLLNNVCCGR